MAAPDLQLTIGEVAAMSGIPVHTIRAWERRHAVLAPRRTASQHRRYTLEDVDLLRRVRGNVDARGLSLKLAVAVARGDAADVGVRADAADAEPDPGGAPWRATVDALALTVALVDQRGVIVDASVGWAKVAGMLRPAVAGRRLVDFVQPADRAKATRLYRPRLQARRGWELNMRTTGEGLFSFDAHVLAVSGGHVLALVGTPVVGAGLEYWTV